MSPSEADAPAAKPFVTRGAPFVTQALRRQRSRFMLRTMRYCASFVLAAVAVVSAAPASASLGRVRAEIDRVRADARQLGAEDRAALESRLERASAALDARRLYLAVYELERAAQLAAGWTFARVSAGVATLDAFERTWTSAGEPRWTPAPRHDRPLVLDALAAAAGSRGPVLYRASRPFAADADVKAGLYYIGAGQGEVRFATLLESLDWRADGARPPVRSIAREIDAFDREMTTAYEQMTRAEHPIYIQASEALKEARALNDAGRVDGALLEYLIARVRFAPLRKTTYPAPTAEAVASARAALRTSIDNSLPELFLQMADAGLASGDADATRTAAIVLADILPAYQSAVAPPPATTDAGGPGARVTITLVRWPFT